MAYSEKNSHSKVISYMTQYQQEAHTGFKSMFFIVLVLGDIWVLDGSTCYAIQMTRLVPARQRACTWPRGKC